MQGTLNGIPLNRIIAIRNEPGPNGSTLYVLRMIDGPLPELEARLQTGGDALLILGNHEIKGRLLHYSKDAAGYNITIEATPSQETSRSASGLQEENAAVRAYIEKLEGEIQRLGKTRNE